jgi:RNA polymerase sigma factor (sigma-70 family)
MDTHLERYISGDPDALTPLYLQHRPRLLLLAYGACRNREVARDAVQDVFEKLCRLTMQQRRDYFGTDRSTLEAWLRVAVWNRVNDILKVSAAREKKNEANRYRMAVNSENGVIHRLSEDAYTALMGRLQCRQREVMTLHVMGYRNEEIAGMLHLTYNTVKNNIYEARQQLKRHWRDYME